MKKLGYLAAVSLLVVLGAAGCNKEKTAPAATQPAATTDTATAAKKAAAQTETAAKDTAKKAEKAAPKSEHPQ